MPVMRVSKWFIVLACLSVLAACGGSSESDDRPIVLPSVEEFNWGGQPISVSPPPVGWRREKEQSGGLRGVRFVKTGSIGEVIVIAEHSALDERDRCARFEKFLSDFDNLSPSGFARMAQRTALYASPPIHHQESQLAERANGYLMEARTAFQQDDPIGARSAVTTAFAQAVKIRYSLDEVVDRVMFSADSFNSFGTVEVESPTQGEVGAQASISVDFSLDSRDKGALFHGREVYVVKNNRLFVLTYLGLPENLSIFDAVVDSVSFPPGRCVH